MKHIERLVIFGFALCAVLAACDDNNPISIGTQNQAKVRFVNAISGVNTNLALKANSSMVGSAQSFANFTSGCTALSTGNTTFAFGTPNTGGTDITTSLATSTATLANGNYLAVATGTATSPQLLVLSATPATAAASGTANVRIINATAGGAVDVFATTSGGTTGSTPTVANVGAFGASSFVNIPTSNTTLVFRNAGTSTTVFTTSGLSLQSGGSYTVLLLPSSSGAGFQTLVVNGSCT